MAKKIQFAVVNVAALVLVVALCVRLIRRWTITSGDFHYWAIGLLIVFALLWASLLREKNSPMSLGTAALVLFAAEGSIREA